MTEEKSNEQRVQDTIDDLHQAVEKSGGEIIVDPNQITLEDAIEESTKEIETAVDRLADVNNAIVDMLGPHTETPEETLLKAAVDTLGDPDEDYELGEAPSFEDTLDLVKEQQEEELEIDDDTFEL